MAAIAVDENALQVINSFRPYLGPRGKSLVDVLKRLLDFLSGEGVQECLKTVSNSLALPSRGLFGAENRERKANPFTLFLILILLLLSDFSGHPGGERN